MAFDILCLEVALFSGALLHAGWQELSRTFANLEKIWDEYNVYEKQVDRE